MSTRWPTLIEDGDGLLILDQTCLPREAVMLRLATLDDVVKAIRVMQVRGAPLIGATAAYGVALGLADDAGDAVDAPDGGQSALGAGAHAIGT